MPTDDEPDHALLPEPWTYNVRGLRIEFDQASSLGNWLEMTLVREHVCVSLRFEGVQQLKIDENFPHINPRLRILDIANRGWDGLKVRVQSLENGPYQFLGSIGRTNRLKSMRLRRQIFLSGQIPDALPVDQLWH